MEHRADEVRGQAGAGRIVRRAEKHKPRIPVAAGDECVEVGNEVGIRAAGERSDRGALDGGVVAVQRKARRERGDGVAPGPAERADQQVDRFATAAGHEQSAGRHTEAFGELAAQCRRTDFGIPVQRPAMPVATAAPRHFVGVQAHRPLDLNGGGVGPKGENLRARPLGNAHRRLPSRRVTARACASRPSSLASVTTVSPSPRSPSAVSSWTVMLRRN